MGTHAVRTFATDPKRSAVGSFFGAVVLYRLIFAHYPVTKKCIERYSDSNTDTDPKCQAFESKANATSDCKANRQLTEGRHGTFAFLFTYISLHRRSLSDVAVNVRN